MKALVRPLALLGLLLLPLAGARAAEPTYPTDQVLGRPDAPITIIDYSSTTCGHCATFHKTTLPRLKAEWIDTGKAKLVFRDFPTSPAALSLGAAMIPHCAGPDRYFGLLGGPGRRLPEAPGPRGGHRNPRPRGQRPLRHRRHPQLRRQRHGAGRRPPL